MTLKLPIYMDNHATTALDPRVLEAMLPYFTEVYGNAASRSHSFGWTAEKAIDQAREQVGALIGASGKEIVWTSGATESDNLAIKGAAEFLKDRGNHIITAQTEHKAVLDTCKRLEKEGFEVTYLPVDDGRARRPGGRARGDDRQDDPGLDHARQQRDRHGEPGRRDRRGREGEGRAVPHRRRPGRRQDSVRRQCGARGSGVAVGAQDVRAQGRGRALRAAQAARAHHRDHRRRRARARHALGHAERAGHRRLRQGGRAVPRSRWPEESKRMLALRERLRKGIRSA